MLVSTLIKKLRAIKVEHGDLPVNHGSDQAVSMASVYDQKGFGPDDEGADKAFEIFLH